MRGRTRDGARGESSFLLKIGACVGIWEVHAFYFWVRENFLGVSSAMSERMVLKIGFGLGLRAANP